MESIERPIKDQIAASLKGDKDAFGELVARYQGMVCSVAYNIVGSLDASEDLAQETFVTAWQRLGELRETAKLPAWLCGIARNLARNALRRRRRDPLDHAAELDEGRAAESGRAAEAGGAAEALGRAEREALLWRTLAAIPEEYREPLILFYREGQSVRAVAEALEITEACARQRLSRGRKLLKAQVARFVEDSLRETRPGSVFTLAVVAALPLATAQVATAGAVASAGAASGKGAVGASLAAGLGAGALGGLAGALIGMTGGFFGMGYAIRSAPTLRARRFVLQSCAWTYAFIWVLLGYEGMCGVLAWRRVGVMLAWSAAGWVVYLLLLIWLIVRTNRSLRRIVEEDLGRKPAPTLPLEQSPLALARIWRTFSVGLAVAIIGSAGAVAWIHSMPSARSLWPAVAVLTIASHVLFTMLFRWGARISRDEGVFAAAPPAVTAEAMLARLDGRPAGEMAAGSSGPGTRGPSTRALFYNDLSALAGSLFGPMAPYIAMCVQQGDGATAWAIGVVTALALTAAMVARRRPERRRWAFFGVCLFMGAFSVAITSWKWESWASAGVLRLPDTFGFWLGAIPCALFWAIGFAMLRVLAPRRPEERQNRGIHKVS